MIIDDLRIAVRGYPVSANNDTDARARSRRALPDHAFVFDCETRTDAQQSLTFGCYRYYLKGQCIEEGLFYADDLKPDELACLHEYVRLARADVKPPYADRLELRDRTDFLRVFYQAAFKARAVLVGFNLPFDLSRLAFDVSEARGMFIGGFSFVLWDRTLPNGIKVENRFRPRVVVKHIDSKRALKAFTKAAGTDKVDLIPEDSADGKPDTKYGFRGHFLDLRTLVFALTDRGHSLESACAAFGVEHGKLKAQEHGKITPQYIDYCRRDVQATAELYERATEEYARHPIDLQATKAYSPASIGKGYLRAMGVQPVLSRQPGFSPAVIGNGMSAFFGGRTGAHIRRIPVPVVYCDFLSMYPTVNVLMALWRFMIARRIEVVEATDEVIRFLTRVTKERLFNPDIWRKLPAFVQLEADGGILPVRAAYNEVTKDWQVGVNYLHAGQLGEKLWYALPDVVTSVLLTGKVPRIVRAMRLVPKGRQSGLKPVLLGGKVVVDPRRTDFFKTIIEERKRLGSRSDLTDEERGRLDRFLKILANATSYGILAEMVRHELADGKTQKVSVYGVDADPYGCEVSAPETPGEFCFPPIAALITSAARLQLALLERCVTDLGGTYAMEDTDSMAIVAQESGGLIPCQGGSHRVNGGNEAIRALSWDQVHGIVEQFELLNPYDREAVPGSVLKVEQDNFDPVAGHQRQIHCFAISAKRYALFVYNEHGEPALLERAVNNKADRWSEHGLGHLLNPIDPDSVDRDWTRKVWLKLIREALGFDFARPAWFDRPAFSRISVSSPAVLKPLAALNAEKPYSAQIKPFNFLLSAHIDFNGNPIGIDTDRFHLIAPYESDARKWKSLVWTDQYTGNMWRGTTIGSGTRVAARLKTYGDVVMEYSHHPESKSAGASGVACGRQTVGQLQRRHVSMGSLHHIGKESNRLEDVLDGGVACPDEAYTEYRQPNCRELSRLLSGVALREASRETGIARSTLQRFLNGSSKPRASTSESIKAFVLSERIRG